MEKTVLSKEEVEKLSNLQQEQNDLVFQLGQIELQQNFLEKSKNQVYQQLEALETNQSQVAQELEKKYGRGTVNLESGEYIQA